MLAKPNRVVRGEDFRATMRRGRRVSTHHALVYISERAGTEPARFGFVVAKTVGNAVIRNRVRRRLRAIAAEKVAAGFQGRDVVIRPLPGSATASWDNLHQEISDAMEKGVKR